MRERQRRVAAVDETGYLEQAMYAWSVAMEPFFLVFGPVPLPDEERLVIALVRAPFAVRTFLDTTPPPRYQRLHRDLWHALVGARAAVTAARAGAYDRVRLADVLEDLQIILVEINRQMADPSAAAPHVE